MRLLDYFRTNAQPREEERLRQENERLRQEIERLREQYEREFHVPCDRVKDPCPICLEELSVPGIHVRTPCWHFYHLDCWRSFKEHAPNDECALCRSVMGTCRYACVHSPLGECARENGQTPQAS